MVLQFNDFCKVTFCTESGQIYDVLPLPDSRLAVPKDTVSISISFFPKSKHSK